MSAILVLLALMSVATLASRRGYAAFAAHIVTVPLLLGVGVVASPRALGLFTASVADSLIPAMHVGAAWLSLLVGMRASRPFRGKDWWPSAASTGVVSALTWAGTSAAAFGLLLASSEYEMGFADPAGNRLTAVGAALLLGGLVTGTGLSFTGEALEKHKDRRLGRMLMFVSRHDDVVGAFAVCAAVWLWPISAQTAPIYADPPIAVAVMIGLSFTLFLAQLLTGGTKTGGDQSQPLIAVLGLLVFATGLSTTATLPAAALAFFFGGFLACTQGADALLPRLKKTERPVSLVVLILVGVQLGFSWAAVLVGLAVAAARILTKLIFRAIAGGRSSEPIPVSAVLGSSRVAIPLALSFAITRPEPLGQSEILTAVCVCVSACDLITLLTWRRHAGHTDAEPAHKGEGKVGGPSELGAKA